MTLQRPVRAPSANVSQHHLSSLQNHLTVYYSLNENKAISDKQNKWLKQLKFKIIDYQWLDENLMMRIFPTIAWDNW